MRLGELVKLDNEDLANLIGRVSQYLDGTVDADHEEECDLVETLDEAVQEGLMTIRLDRKIESLKDIEDLVDLFEHQHNHLLFMLGREYEKLYGDKGSNPSAFGDFIDSLDLT